jgi:hypothetical protein
MKKKLPRAVSLVAGCLLALLIPASAGALTFLGASKAPAVSDGVRYAAFTPQTGSATILDTVGGGQTTVSLGGCPVSAYVLAIELPDVLDDCNPALNPNGSSPLTPGTVADQSVLNVATDVFTQVPIVAGLDQYDAILSPFSGMGASWLLGIYPVASGDSYLDAAVAVNRATLAVKFLAPAEHASHFGIFGGPPVDIDKTSLPPLYACSPGSPEPYVLHVVPVRGTGRHARHMQLQIQTCPHQRVLYRYTCVGPRAMPGAPVYPPASCTGMAIRDGIATWVDQGDQVYAYVARTRRLVHVSLAFLHLASDPDYQADLVTTDAALLMSVASTAGIQVFSAPL